MKNKGMLLLYNGHENVIHLLLGREKLAFRVISQNICVDIFDWNASCLLPNFLKRLKRREDKAYHVMGYEDE